MFEPLLSFVRVTSPPLRSVRYLTQVTTHPSAKTNPVSYPYFVPRNTRGNLPVYTDIRNGGTRYIVLVRNVDGNVNVCKFTHRLIPPKLLTISPLFPDACQRSG